MAHYGGFECLREQLGPAPYSPDSRDTEDGGEWGGRGSKAQLSGIRAQVQMKCVNHGCDAADRSVCCHNRPKDCEVFLASLLSSCSVRKTVVSLAKGEEV